MNGEVAGRRVLCSIARSAFEVISRLLDLDQRLARDLRSEETSSRQVYREEHITTCMAATLLEKFPENVSITLFTPPEETKNGADWYWRFERRGRGAIHARVQAKRVQRTEFNQPDPQGIVDIDQQQLDRLIRSTREATSEMPGLEAWLATFARFDATPPCGCRRKDLSDCSHHRHDPDCVERVPSLWIAKAGDVLRLGKVPVARVVEHSIRLDCLLPCIDRGIPTGPADKNGPRQKNFTLVANPPPYEECVAYFRQDPSIAGAMQIAV
jgi:hypothetical protein